MSIEDKIKGVLFGGAIGDALGLGSEFMTKAEVQKYYPNGLYSYSQIVQDHHRSRWQKGDWTDDTDMMLCIAEAIIKDKDIIPINIAYEFKRWFRNNPLGIGRHTFNVLSLYEYEQYPFKVSECIWTLNNKKSAANGGIMRTSIIGIWNNNIAELAECVCKLTHFDPRCIGSCVILSSLIHSLVYKDETIPLEELIKTGNKYDERIAEYLLMVQSNNLETLYLDDNTMGYTLKTMAAAIWCLYHCNSFEEGLLTIVKAGGDADTNAAVSCSLLGAKFGYNAIPKQYVNELNRKEHLTTTIKKLTNIMMEKIYD